MTNPVKQKLREGRKTCGAFLQTLSPVAAEILAQAGFDWLIVDLEHTPGSYENLQSQLQAMSGTDVLDTGVMGVLIPYVNTAEEAAAGVAACKYPPMGVRGVAGSPRAAGYTGNTMPYLESANDDTVVMVAVETLDAVNNLDDILTVDGLDGIFVGPMDLASSMGHLGNPGHPEAQEQIAIIEKKVLASDKFLGTVATSWDKAVSCYENGYQWLILMQDGAALHQAGTKAVAAFRDAY